MNNDFVKVWAFDEAPQEYQDLSTHGGDEDWVAFIPKRLAKRHWYGWMENGTPFGICDVIEYRVRGGFVRIGAHG